MCSCVFLPGGVGHGVEGVLDGVHIRGEPREQRHDLLSLLLLPHPHVRIRPDTQQSDMRAMFDDGEYNIRRRHQLAP